MVKRIVFALVLILNLSAGCGIIPDSFNFGIDANVNANVQTTSDLGQDTLDRIDDINDTLTSGVEVGPETRKTIEELNKTIANGIKAGFDNATLQRVDQLLRVVEDGLKIGLDTETLASLDNLVNTVDRMPGQWETAGTDIIRVLESSAGTVAGRMADEVKGVLRDARLNVQQITASAGAEFRCNVDFLGSKAGATVQEFIGKSIVGKLKAIITRTQTVEALPIPWVCQIIPDQVLLMKVGQTQVSKDAVISVTGYNYVEKNAPTGYVVDEKGQKIPGITLYPFRSSPYQIQLNLQGVDFAAVPARSRLVIAWPNVAETSGVAILLPAYAAPVAGFKADPTSGAAPLKVTFTDNSTNDPTGWTWNFGDGTTSLERNPVHTFTAGKEYLVSLTATNAMGSSNITQKIVVGGALAANFTFTPRNGEAPMTVQFTDQSTGGPTAWEWDFGDGQKSTERNPQHVYLTPKPEGYVVTLKVTGPQGTNSKTSPDRVVARQKLDADFKANVVSGKAPLTVKFTDTSKGTNITGWKWDFGDGTTPSTAASPLHVYSKSGLFSVTLEITGADHKIDRELKTGYITASGLLRMPIGGLQTLFAQTNSAIYKSFVLPMGGAWFDTGISADQYVCGLWGMQANKNAYVGGASNSGFIKAYAQQQYSNKYGRNTWQLIGDLFSGEVAEEWAVDVVCLDRKTENKGFVYKEYKNIKSGAGLATGLKTDSYYYCGVVGVWALNGVPFMSGINSVIYQGYMSTESHSGGDEWEVNVNATSASGETIMWNANVLCLAGGSHLATDTPTFLTRTYSIESIPSHRLTTDINTSDYVCGVVGGSAERGRIYFSPSVPPAYYIKMHMYQEGGKWAVEADWVTYPGQEESWRVEVLCISNKIAQQAPAP